jgi:hypothetical protein
MPFRAIALVFDICVLHSLPTRIVYKAFTYTGINVRLIGACLLLSITYTSLMYT